MYENSVYEIPASRDSKRCLTESRWIIWLTAKCLPMSRRKSSSRTPPSQSRLSTIFAAGGPSSPAKKRSTCAFSRAVLSVRRSASSSWRSLDLARRIADHPGRAADQRQHLVPGAPQVGHHHQRHQVARVQAGRRRVEAAVDRDRRRQHLAHVLGGRLLDETAPGKLFERAHVDDRVRYLPRLPGQNAVRARLTWRHGPPRLAPRSSSPTASPRSSRRPPTRIRALAADAIAARGRFRVALAGGSTPRALYPHLVDRHRLDAHRRLLRRRARRAARRPPVELPHGARDAARAGARAGGERLPLAGRVRRSRRRRARLRAGAARAPGRALLDLALLGLGPDGHTASLFPGTRRWRSKTGWPSRSTFPRSATRRLTLTYPALLGAGEVFFLVTGARQAGRAGRRPPPRQHAAGRAHRPRSRAACIFCDRRPLKI